MAEAVAGWSLFGERVSRFDGWLVPSDVWQFARGAQYVADGALPYVYESARLTALPLYVVLEAPVYAVGRIHRLSESLSVPNPYPTMWLLLLPFGLLGVVGLALAAGSLGRRLGAPATVVHAGVFLLAVVPTCLYGHFEDACMLAAVIAAVCWSLDGRQRRAALALGVAIAFKQTAVLVAPAMFATGLLAPNRRRLLEMAAVPAVLTLPPLLLDWQHASRALLRTPNYVTAVARVAPWVPSSASTVDAGPPRLALAGLVVCSALVVWRRRRRDVSTMLALAGVASVARIVVEPVTHAYYLSPGLVLLMLASPSVRSRWTTLALGSACLLLYRWHGAPAGLWWALMVATVLVTAGSASWAVTRAQALHSEPTRGSLVGGV